MIILKIIKFTAAVGIALLLASKASAETTGKLFLAGRVSERPSIRITAETREAVVDLAVRRGQGLKVASFTEQDSRRGGCIVTVTSANGGVLRGVSASRALPYSLTYGDAPVGPLSPGVPALITDTSGVKPSESVKKDVVISPAGTGSLPSDTYADLLTFEIRAK